MALNTGLNVSNVVNVLIQMSPTAAQVRNFGNLLVMGDSKIIDTVERSRAYTSLDDIATDFGGDAPEYLAAALYFGQAPQPLLCYIGRWASTATNARLRGAVRSSAAQAMGAFNAINSGGLNITIDGTVHTVTNLNFTGAANLNAVAATLQTALAGVATVQWIAKHGYFIIDSATTGQLSSVSFATAPSAGVDVSSILGLTNAGGAYAVPGITAESLSSVVALLANQSTSWYGLQVASTAIPSNNDVLAVSTFIEGSSVSRIFGVTTQDPATIDPNSTTDLASLLSAANYRRTFTQYSSTNPYVTASIFGRAFTVDFTGVNTAITLDFKQEPGVTPELLTQTQALVLDGKNCNVFTQYNNNTSILQNGCMSSGDWFDAIQGTDWLQNEIQTDVYNAMYTSTTKIPETDAGVNQLVTAMTPACERAVANGLVAPGTWTGPALGAIVPGQTLTKGYYIFAPAVATQSVADRGARKSPAIQCAIKLAGAIQSANILVSVNQ